MADREPSFSRMSRKKGKKDKLLNILIGVVILLILIVGVTYIAGNGKDEAKEESQTENAPKEPIVIEEPNDEVAKDKEEDAPEKESADENEMDEHVEGQIVNENNPDKLEDNDGDSVTVAPSSDNNVKETVIDSDWKPVGTSQTGEHVSKYDGESDDWNEKKQAIAYATGLSEDQMIFWRIQNGGGPQKSEGIVSSKDKSEKYKVYLEWVDGEGWKPVKMDVLNTLETK
ncbi:MULTISPECIES: DUF1510 family protein [Sporosarcina]|uniref:DUF1510 family protein n=1 Tax=Sporosarcina TaxID=1569 RepID=UPI001891A821|nr:MULTISPECIES: DUF1510 family protein [Sporosarcina]GKV66757.1 putative membrane protein YrrS [Sporosarcina sp. NCCP-2331]GLB57060.1 putative membrane protein YrrS [Sporosarcina sp. NCCP-2378]